MICHPERSEVSDAPGTEILRCAQDDKSLPFGWKSSSGRRGRKRPYESRIRSSKFIRHFVLIRRKLPMSILERLPHANVKRLEFGRGIANDVGAQFGRYVVATMSIPCNVVSQRIGKPPTHVIDVPDMDLESAIALEASTPPCDTVVAVGGGQSMDMGKYIAWKRGIPLVNIPTIVSTNAYVTQAVGVR